MINWSVPVAPVSAGLCPRSIPQAQAGRCSHRWAGSCRGTTISRLKQWEIISIPDQDQRRDEEADGHRRSVLLSFIISQKSNILFLQLPKRKTSRGSCNGQRNFHTPMDIDTFVHTYIHMYIRGINWTRALSSTTFILTGTPHKITNTSRTHIHMCSRSIHVYLLACI